MHGLWFSSKSSDLTINVICLLVESDKPGTG